jgi:hypothetical protein
MYERGSFARRLAGVGPTVFSTWVKLPTIETVELRQAVDEKASVRLERTISVTGVTSLGVLFRALAGPGG